MQEIVKDYFMAKLPVERTGTLSHFIIVFLVPDGNNDGMRHILLDPSETQPFFEYCDKEWLAGVGESFEDLIRRVGGMVR